MTLLDMLIKAGSPAGALKELLERIAAAAPDLAPLAQEWIAKLGQAVDPAGLAAVGAAIPGELLNIAQGKIEPRDHPSDAI